ncbi:hypothetical protein PV08_04325 [Exophiala spinifera]|uniref:Choloylglycine hydrolase/NAAA C-terminal domain-containing protein n=1 Tax=Exophiala spinifera TaxID=91928 RepID=A0A0D2C0H4_9EURO|nr:uncharacterized protein PV08_04325 [Exophiala spinifera]KIW17134.1 hypothetical protein PV08_04325 [Exophiala spinifera]
MFASIFTLCLPLLGNLITHASACSRVTYNSGPGDNNRIIVGRSMDWFVATNASIWAFPPGMNRSGNAGPNSLNWTSKYGSVVTAMYYAATVDGINSEGLTGNFLYLSDSDYGARNDAVPGLSVGAWLQYFLDNYATVDEAAKDLYTPEGRQKFQIVTTEIIPGTPSVGHVSLADASGDNLILEYLDGVLTVHHGKQYTVLTNQPPYDQQLAINAYWLPIGNDSLPGTRRPADRFARLSYYNNVTASANDQEESIAVTASMIRAVSVPFSPSLPGQPNVASTLWRTYSDTRALRYYWESSLAPMFFWINLGSMNLTSNAPVRMLALQNVDPETRVGNMDNDFVDSAPFEFLTSAGGSD